MPSGDVLVEVPLKPENTFKFGDCPVKDCKKEIFATHDRFYVIPANGVPSDYIGYDFDINDFAPATYSTLELHRLYFTPTGNCYDFPTGVQGCPSTSTGILFSDPTFQAKLDAILVQEGYAAGDVVVTTNGSVWTTWFSPSFDYTNNTNLFWAGDNTDYFNKITPTIVTNETPSLEDLCLPIQEIKEKDSCTGVETYRYIIEDGLGNLVDAASVITGFNEANVLLSCPSVEEFDIKEREVCVTIDGSTQSYEAIKVYKRSRTSGLATLIHYETKSGNVINGTIVEVCCTCETLCDVPATTSNKVGFGYATLFNGGAVLGDRVVSGEELYLDYLEVDGNVLIGSPLVIGTLTGGFTAADMGYGLSYNKIVDLLNTVPEFAANGVRFVTAAPPLAPNASYDPMCWGVEYDDTKDVRIVIRDKVSVSGISHSFSIRLNPDPNQTYEGILNVITDAGNNWDYTNVSTYAYTVPLSNITSI